VIADRLGEGSRLSKQAQRGRRCEPAETRAGILSDYRP